MLAESERIILLRRVQTTGTVVPREELRTTLWREDGLSHDPEVDHTIQSLNKKLSVDLGTVEMISGIIETVYRLVQKNQIQPLSA